MRQKDRLSSYIRVYNTGNVTTSYSVEVSGNVTDLLSLEAGEVEIEPGQNRRVSVIYEASGSIATGWYKGTVTVFVKGSQVTPGLSKDISVIVVERETNEPPRITGVWPQNGSRIGGRVNFTVGASDPDSTELSYHIFLDGRLIAQTAVCTVDTTLVRNGEHEMLALVEDGENVSQTRVVFTVENKTSGSPWFGHAILGSSITAGVVAAVLIRKRRRWSGG